MGPASFTWQPHPEVWLLSVALLGGYFYALSAWGPRHSTGAAATTRHKLYFVLGVAALWVAGDWPVHLLAGELFSVHMAQHMVFTYLSAPLMILGTPGWLWRRLLAPAPVQAVWRYLTTPLVALIAFNAWMAGSHWPWLVDLSVRSDAIHLLLHALLFGLSLAMWWPVLSPLPEMPHLSYPVGMAYLFGQSVLPTIPASFLTYGESQLFASYAASTPLWGLSPIVDQQIAGLLMKIGGGLVLWGVILVLFFRWHHEEETSGPDILYWRDIAPAVGTSPGPGPASDHEGGLTDDE